MRKRFRKMLKQFIIKEAKGGGYYNLDNLLFEYKNALIEALREVEKEDISRIERRLVELYELRH